MGIDLDKLTHYLVDSVIRSADLVTARALIRLVQDSIRERSTFRLSDLDRTAVPEQDHCGLRVARESPSRVC